MPQPKKLPNIAQVVRSCILEGRLRETHHAQVRMLERGISRPDVHKVLLDGHREPRKDQIHPLHQNWCYAFAGVSVDGRRIRVVVSLDEDLTLVVTVVKL